MTKRAVYMHPAALCFDLKRCLSPVPVASGEVVDARTLNGHRYPTLRDALEGELSALAAEKIGNMRFKGAVDGVEDLDEEYAGDAGDYFYCTDDGKYYAWKGDAWAVCGDAARIANGSVTPRKTTFITGGGFPNLMEGISIAADKQLNNIGNMDDSAGYDTTLNGIPVSAGLTYCFSVDGQSELIAKIVFKTADNITATDWDEVNGTYISNSVNVNGSIVAPASAKYMFISFYRATHTLADLVVQQADEPQPVADDLTLSRFVAVPQCVRSNLFGKTMMTLGDSLSEGGYWQSHVQKWTGLSAVKDLSAGGTKINVFANNVTSQNIADVDIVFVMGLFNSTGSAPGSPGDEPSNAENASVCAGYKYIVEKLYSLKPSVRIVLASPHRPRADDVAEKAKAVGMVAAYYGIPFIDLYNTAGFNALTYDTFLRDAVHSSESGYEREAELIAGGLVRFFG